MASRYHQAGSSRIEVAVAPIHLAQQHGLACLAGASCLSTRVRARKLPAKSGESATHRAEASGNRPYHCYCVDGGPPIQAENAGSATDPDPPKSSRRNPGGPGPAITERVEVAASALSCTCESSACAPFTERCAGEVRVAYCDLGGGVRGTPEPWRERSGLTGPRGRHVRGRGATRAGAPTRSLGEPRVLIAQDKRWWTSEGWLACALGAREGGCHECHPGRHGSTRGELRQRWPADQVPSNCPQAAGGRSDSCRAKITPGDRARHSLAGTSASAVPASAPATGAPRGPNLVLCRAGRPPLTAARTLSGASA
jgi:hypothetical protein